MLKRLARLINRYIKRYWLSLLAIVALQIVATIMSLYLPTLNARIIDEGVVKGDIPYIWQAGWTMLGFATIQALAQITSVYLGARTAMGFGRDVRAAVFSQALSFSTRELNKFGAPSLITRNTNDVQQVQMLVFMTTVMLVGAPITMVGGVYMALREDPGLSWIIVVAVAALGTVIAILITLMGPLFQTMQKRIDDLNRVVREQITGIRVVRAFVREPFEAERFKKTNTQVTDVSLRVGRIMAVMFPFVGLVMNVSSVGVMWFGGFRIESGDIQIGQLTAFLTYLMQILISVMMTTILFVLAPRSAVSADRILDVIETESSVVTTKHPVTPLSKRSEDERRAPEKQPVDGSAISTPGGGARSPEETEVPLVTFQDVEFTYPGAEAPVLKSLNFALRRGTTTAIIGATGSGKSTLVNLIPRLFDATGGEVKVDGVNVRDLDPDVLWSMVGIVPQRPYLFSGTIASNLRYGKPDANEEELWDALRIAQASDFVAEKDNQLDAEISQGGTNVSGGQRQRLSIARALVKKPDIYVFDDSFSALDVATDARLRAALAPETKESAVLIVAQRVSTIVRADEIIVLEDGEIVGKGTHDELLATCETYKEIVESQLNTEEAAA